MPAWIRSSSSTLAGSLAIICSAMRRTSGWCCASRCDFSMVPCAVYTVVLLGLSGSAGSGHGLQRLGHAPWPAVNLAGNAPEVDSGMARGKGLDDGLLRAPRVGNERVEAHPACG